MNFYKAPWETVKEELKKINWENMEELAKSCPTSALREFHNQVLGVLEQLVPLKPKRVTRSRPRMHRMRRLLWRRLAKVRRRFKSARSIHQITGYMQQMWSLESQLSDDYLASNNKEEDEAVLRMKLNSKAFFSFARSRQKVKAKVGPFLDLETGTPNPSPDFAAEALSQQ